MRAWVRRIPFPFVGYVLILIGFVGLGLFVAAQAHGLPAAPYLGVAMVVAYGAGTACFRYRAHQMRNASPSDPVLLHFDPMIPNTEKRDLERYQRIYRGLAPEEDLTPADRVPRQSLPARRRDPMSSTGRRAQLISPRRVPSVVAR